MEEKQEIYLLVKVEDNNTVVGSYSSLGEAQKVMLEQLHDLWKSECMDAADWDDAMAKVASNHKKSILIGDGNMRTACINPAFSWSRIDAIVDWNIFVLDAQALGEVTNVNNLWPAVEWEVKFED